MESGGQPLRVWAISDGRVGIEVQARGLAAAVAARAASLGRPGGEVAVFRVAPRRPWLWLPARLWPDALAAVRVTEGPALAPPWPDVVVSTGRRAAPVTAALRARGRAAGAGTFAVHVQRPYLPLERFDLVVTPRHDRLSGPNVETTLGGLGLVTPAELAAAARDYAPRVADLPRPFVAVSVGGRNKVYRFAAAEARRLAADLRRAWEATGGSLLVTVSRRTGPEATEALRDALAGIPQRFYDGQGPNPYFAFLGLADAVVVTCDSVNLASDAAATGRPVLVWRLPGGSAKFDAFHRALEKAGIARPFEGAIPLAAPGAPPLYPPLAETERVAAAVVARLADRDGSAPTRT